jgi:hypothetical protein
MTTSLRCKNVLRFVKADIVVIMKGGYVNWIVVIMKGGYVNWIVVIMKGGYVNWIVIIMKGGCVNWIVVIIKGGYINWIVVIMKGGWFNLIVAIMKGGYVNWIVLLFTARKVYQWNMCDCCAVRYTVRVFKYTGRLRNRRQGERSWSFWIYRLHSNGQ